jgi:hypothetical protein
LAFPGKPSNPKYGNWASIATSSNPSNPQPCRSSGPLIAFTRSLFINSEDDTENREVL